MSISEREGDTYPLSTAKILKMSRTILTYFDDPNDKVRIEEDSMLFIHLRSSFRC